MNRNKTALDHSLKLFVTRVLGKRVHFPKRYIGKTLLMEDGKKFQVFRDLLVDPNQHLGEPVAVFKVRFKFSGLPLFVNKYLSMFPAPFLIANSGFFEKIWTLSEDGYFQGIYQWSSEESAASYPQSFIFRMMTKRSQKGTLEYEVIRDTILSMYIKKLIK